MVSRNWKAILLAPVLLLVTGCSALGIGGSGANSSETIKYDDGNYLYAPEADPVVDKETLVSYFPNVLNVFLTEPVKNKEARAIAESVDGEVVGEISGGMDMVQILNDAPDLQSLENAKATLLEQPKVQFVALEHPVTAQDMSVATLASNDEAPDNPDTSGLLPLKDMGDTTWWVDAIGADKVWEALNQHPDLFKNGVTLSVFEPNTIDTHYLNAGPKEEANWDDARHAMRVARFAAAEPDTRGLQGTGQFSTVLSHSVSADSLSRQINPFTRTSQQTYALKKAVEDAGEQDGKVVVNASVGHAYCTSDGWEKSTSNSASEGSENKENTCSSNADVDSYESYQEFARNEARESSAYMLMGLLQLKSRGFDPLIVQAAGNGPADIDFSELEPLTNPPDAKITGFFAGIDKALFEDVCASSKDCGDTFEQVAGNIIVVGGMDRIEGGFEPSPWAHTGEQIEILAPASNVAAAWENEGYTGTSFSAPMVSGTAGTIWSMAPSLTASEVKQIILESSKQELSRRDYTYPTLNSWGAVKATADRLNVQIGSAEDLIFDLYNQYLDDDASFLPSKQDKTDYAGWWPGTADFNGDRNSIVYSYALVDITKDGYPELITSVRETSLTYSRVFSAIPSNGDVVMVEFTEPIMWGASSAGGVRTYMGVSDTEPGMFVFQGLSMQPKGTLEHYVYSYDNDFKGSVKKETLGEFESAEDVVPDFTNFYDFEQYDRADRSPLTK